MRYGVIIRVTTEASHNLDEADFERIIRDELRGQRVDVEFVEGAYFDMLAALEEARQFVAKWAHDHAGHDSEPNVIGVRMLNKMEAALKKARGDA